MATETTKGNLAEIWPKINKALKRDVAVQTAKAYAVALERAGFEMDGQATIDRVKYVGYIDTELSYRCHEIVRRSRDNVTVITGVGERSVVRHGQIMHGYLKIKGTPKEVVFDV